jgi:uncharacterized protein (TIGR00251 family)
MSRPSPTARSARLPIDADSRSAARGAGLIEVRVIPRAGKSGVAGLRDGALLVRLAAAPVDGAANAELIAVLAGALHLPKRSIQIVSGERSRSKRVQIAGMTAGAVMAALGIDPTGPS